MTSTSPTRMASDLLAIANEVRAIPNATDKQRAARLADAGIDDVASRVEQAGKVET